MDRFKFRVWVNGEMIYPETKDKPCDFILGQDGVLHSYPSKLEETYDPCRYEDAIWMAYTGFDATQYPIYQDDIVRDCFGDIGEITKDKEKGYWIVKYRYCGHIFPLHEYDCPNELVNIGNIHQHSDWKNWAVEKPKSISRQSERS